MSLRKKEEGKPASYGQVDFELWKERRQDLCCCKGAGTDPFFSVHLLCAYSHIHISEVFSFLCVVCVDIFFFQETSFNVYRYRCIISHSSMGSLSNFFFSISICRSSSPPLCSLSPSHSLLLPLSPSLHISPPSLSLLIVSLPIFNLSYHRLLRWHSSALGK